MKKFILSIFLICLMVSCKKEMMSPEYLIVATNDLASNKEGLSFVNEKIKKIQLFERNIRKRDNVRIAYDSVIIADEIAKLFNPDNFDCPLPRKIKNRLKENSWAPAFVANKVKDKLPKYALHFDGTNISVLLNSITVKKTDGNESEIVVLGAPSYSNFYVQNYMDNSRAEFTYSLDFSGYLNAALSTSARGGGAEISQSAKLCMDKSGMLMLARGYIFSPLFAALRPNAFPEYIIQNNYQRLATLFSILEALPEDFNEEDEIITPMEYDVIWTSISGNSSFNGEGSLKSNAGGSLGVVSASFNSDGGASISKQTSFKEYETYILNSEVLTNYTPVKINEIKNTIKVLTSRAVIERPCEIVNGEIRFAVQFPKGYADLDWSLVEPAYSIVKIELDKSNLCSFTVRGPSNSSSDFITLVANHKGINLEHKILLP